MAIMLSRPSAGTRVEVYNGPFKRKGDEHPRKAARTQIGITPLTGDIIGSSRLRSPQLRSVRLSLVNAVDIVRRWKRGLVKGKLEFFRGDGWQLLLTAICAIPTLSNGPGVRQRWFD